FRLPFASIVSITPARAIWRADQHACRTGPTETRLPGWAKRTRSAPRRQALRRRREPHMFAMRSSSKLSLPPHDAAQLLLPAQSENEKLPHLEFGSGSSAVSRAKSGAWKMRGARRGSGRPQRHVAYRAELDQPDLGDRCLNDTASGL